MKISKTYLQSLIRECINEMHDELAEASTGKVKFDLTRLQALAKKDKFIANVLKKTKPEVVFNTYVLGDSEMERAYMNEHYRVRMNEATFTDWAIEWNEFNNRDALVRKTKSFKTEKAREQFIKKLEGKDNFNQILAYSDPQTNEMTTTADVVGYDAPFGAKRKKND